MGLARRADASHGLERHAVRLLAAQAQSGTARLHRRCVMADECKRYDVAIVGSGVAGALIAKQLATRGKKVVILEAGGKNSPKINDYMERVFSPTLNRAESPVTTA